ncbi:MAG: phosphate signaling complex protein PhoU [Planctomycetaceae bacterium]|nr:phosphate signaling complex protein PhoU [Planctomycetaceae bacterium]
MSMHLARDLEVLHQDLISMCGHVEEMIHLAVGQFDELNYELAEGLAAKDDEIDAWDVRIEESCLKMLALHQPVAVDLRRIATVLKVAGELERVADLAVNIAERACGLASAPEVAIPDRLKELAKLAVDMLHRAIDSYVELDCDKALAVCAEDDDVDALNREIIDELIGFMHEMPDRVESLLHLFSASRQLERVADHATNIAEDVVYLVEGTVIRHRRHLVRSQIEAPV